MGLVAEVLKRSTLVEKKLPRDADGDGIIYEGTPLERPLRPGDKILHEGKPKVVQSIVGRRIRLKDPDDGTSKRVSVGSPKLDPHEPEGATPAPRRTRPAMRPVDEVFSHPAVPTGTGEPRQPWKHEQKTVKISDLVPTQPSLVDSHVERYVTGADGSSPMRISPAPNGKFYVLDGHHRVAAAKRAGKTTITADFVSTDSTRTAYGQPRRPTTQAAVDRASRATPPTRPPTPSRADAYALSRLKRLEEMRTFSEEDEGYAMSGMLFSHRPDDRSPAKPDAPLKHETVELPIGNIRPTQRKVKIAGVRHFVEGGTSSDGLPTVSKRGDKYYLHDGHHRVAAAKLRGETTIRVDLIQHDSARAWREEQRGEEEGANESAASSPQSAVRLRRSQLPHPSLKPNSEQQERVKKNQEEVLAHMSAGTWSEGRSAYKGDYVGMPVDDIKAKETAYVKSVTDPASARIVTRITARALTGVLNAGRFKTQHENNRSQGLLAPDTRRSSEERVHGLPEDMDPEMRPVFGYVTDADEKTTRDGGFLMQYGDVIVVMKNDVRERTTIAADDTLGAEDAVVAMPIDDADWRVGALNPRYGWPKLASRLGKLSESPNYMEAQIHGGVHLEDIDHVILPGHAEPDSPLVRKLKRKNIKFTIQDDTEDRLTMKWQQDERRNRDQAKRSEQRIALLDSGELEPRDGRSSYYGNDIESQPRKFTISGYEGVRPRRRYVQREVSREEYVKYEREKAARLRDSSIKAADEAHAKVLEYLKLYQEGKLERLVDVKSMSGPKIRAWYIELKIRKLAGEKVEHLYNEASEEAGSRGPRDSEGMGYTVPKDGYRAKQKWRDEVRKIIADLRERGIRVPNVDDPEVRRALFLN